MAPAFFSLRSQIHAVVLALLLARWVPAVNQGPEWMTRALYVLLVGLLVAYTKDKRGGYADGSGTSTERQEFNWHPTLMVLVSD